MGIECLIIVLCIASSKEWNGFNVFDIQRWQCLRWIIFNRLCLAALHIFIISYETSLHSIMRFQVTNNVNPWNKMLLRFLSDANASTLLNPCFPCPFFYSLIFVSYSYGSYGMLVIFALLLYQKVKKKKSDFKIGITVRFFVIIIICS